MGDSEAIAGSCLCGDIAYEISVAPKTLYKCHCSLCRRYTGTAFSSYYAIARHKLKWINGGDKLATYAAPSGYLGKFCGHCSAPMPKLRWEKIYLIPAGSLSAIILAPKIIHLHVDSKAEWDSIPDNETQYPGNLPRE